MEVRRHVKREDRRRRMLRDEPAATSRSSPPTGRGHTISKGQYPAETLTQGQPRFSDFVPRRGWSLLVWFLSGLVVIATVLAADSVRMHGFSAPPPPAAAFLALTGDGTLAVWLSSLMLQLAAVAALIIYSVRRHRLDDYRGTYRRWGWVALGCVWASIDVTVGAHRLVTWVMVELTSTTLWQDGALWWMLIALLSALLLGGPAAADMRGCRLGVFTLSLAGGGYLLVAGHRLALFELGLWVEPTTLPMAVLMVSHWLLCMSFVINAREVLRAADGQTAANAQRSGRRWLRVFSADEPAATVAMTPLSSDASAAAAGTRRAAKSKTPKPARAVTPPAAGKQAPEHAAEHVDEIELLANPQLTKAEKRKLRKKLRRQQRPAA